MTKRKVKKMKLETEEIVSVDISPLTMNRLERIARHADVTVNTLLNVIIGTYLVSHEMDLKP